MSKWGYRTKGMIYAFAIGTLATQAYGGMGHKWLWVGLAWVTFANVAMGVVSLLAPDP